MRNKWRTSLLLAASYVIPGASAQVVDSPNQVVDKKEIVRPLAEALSTSIPLQHDSGDINPLRGHLENGTAEVLGGPLFVEDADSKIPFRKLSIERSILEGPHTLFIQTHGGGEPGNYKFSVDENLSGYAQYLEKADLNKWIKKQNPEIAIIDSCNIEGGLSPETLEHTWELNNLKIVLQIPPGYLGLGADPTTPPEELAGLGDSFTPGNDMNGDQKEVIKMFQVKAGYIDFYYKDPETRKWVDAGPWFGDRRLVDKSIYTELESDNSEIKKYLGEEGYNQLAERIACSPLPEEEKVSRLHVLSGSYPDHLLLETIFHRINDLCSTLDLTPAGLVKMMKEVHDRDEADAIHSKQAGTYQIYLEKKLGIKSTADFIAVPVEIYDQFLLETRQKVAASIFKKQLVVDELKAIASKELLPTDKGGIKIINLHDDQQQFERSIFERWLEQLAHDEFTLQNSSSSINGNRKNGVAPILALHNSTSTGQFIPSPAQISH